MTRRLKILLAALIGMMLFVNLLNLCIACFPSATPPATAKEIKDLIHRSPDPVFRSIDPVRAQMLNQSPGHCSTGGLAR
jgi:hypothetical protein